MGNKSKRILRKIIVKFCEEFIAFRRYDEGETVGHVQQIETTL